MVPVVVDTVSGTASKRCGGAVRANRPSECLDWLFVCNAEELERVLRMFIDYYNGHRPHRALALSPPRAARPAVLQWSGATVKRRERLGGVIHE